MVRTRAQAQAKRRGGHHSRLTATEQDLSKMRDEIMSLRRENALLRNQRLPPPQPIEAASYSCGVCGGTPAGRRGLQQLPCGHRHCPDCLALNISSALSTVPFAPAKCCEILPATIVHAYAANKADATAHAALSAEYLDKDKLYCYVPTCGAYIPASHRDERVGTCPICAARTCRACKAKTHSRPCVQDEASEETQRAEEEGANVALLMELAKRERWQTCPHCKAMVSKRSGCNDIRCLCGDHFCYRCGRVPEDYTKEYTEEEYRTVICSCDDEEHDDEDDEDYEDEDDEDEEDSEEDAEGS